MGTNSCFSLAPGLPALLNQCSTTISLFLALSSVCFPLISISFYLLSPSSLLSRSLFSVSLSLYLLSASSLLSPTLFFCLPLNIDIFPSFLPSHLFVCLFLSLFSIFPSPVPLSPCSLSLTLTLTLSLTLTLTPPHRSHSH